jgi:hypothetical protein
MRPTASALAVADPARIEGCQELLAAGDASPDEPGDSSYAAADVGHHRGVQAVAPFG